MRYLAIAALTLLPLCAQTADQDRTRTQDKTQDKTQAQTRDQACDQTRDRTQARDGSCTGIPLRSSGARAQSARRGR
nr:hypothetical protein [uncultured Holophaga sp.]